MGDRLPRLRSWFLSPLSGLNSLAPISPMACAMGHNISPVVAGSQADRLAHGFCLWLAVLESGRLLPPLLHDFNLRLTLGGEVYGGIDDDPGLGRSELQAMVGGQYEIRNGLGLAFGLLGGKYVASPRVGAQIGFSVDYPDILHKSGPRH